MNINLYEMKRCSFPECKKKLKLFNSMRCGYCSKDYCFLHRLTFDHKCSGESSVAATAKANLRKENPVLKKDHWNLKCL